MKNRVKNKMVQVLDEGEGGGIINILFYLIEYFRLD